MTVRCAECQRLYDDAECWTICPHGPLWAGPNAYCRKHDLVNCQLCPPSAVRSGLNVPIHTGVDH